LRTLLIAKGLHPPWATGEVSYAKGLLYSLASIPENDIDVIYTIDNHRIINARENNWLEGPFSLGRIRETMRLEDSSANGLKKKVLDSAKKSVSSEQFDVIHIAYQGLTPFEISKFILDSNMPLVVKHMPGPAPSYGAALKTKLVYTAGFFLQRKRKIKLSFPTIFSARTYWMGSSERTIIVPPAIDTTQFCPRKAVTLGALKLDPKISNVNFGLENLSASSKLIVYMGWLVPERFPYETLLGGFKKFVERSPDAYLLIIGRQSEHSYGEGETAQNIIDLAKRIGIQDKIGLSLIELSQSEKQDLTSAADLFIYPFTTSRLNPPVVDPPLAILENMASGKAVLATGILSVPEIIQDGSNGFILSHITIKDVSDSFARALESNGLVGDKARDIVVSRFSLESVSNILMRLGQKNS
jgi:glycosyltransferase involved in cell wall biosynthesis